MTRAFFHPLPLLAFALALSALPLAAGPAAAAADKKKKKDAPRAETSLVRVNVTSQSYNYFRPWEKQAPTPRRGLGAVLHRNRVLITAEMVADSSYIELEMPDTGQKVTAEVVGVELSRDICDGDDYGRKRLR